MVVVVLSLLCLSAASSELASNEASEFETVITGNRSSRLIGEGATPAEVIGRADIERSGGENLSTILDDHPGLDVQRNYTGLSGLRIQGLDPKYILILVDGERVTGRVDGVIDLQRFMTDDIERIEILRGPSSALWGSDAVGGVVNIITRRAKKKIEADAHVRYGFGSVTNPMHAIDANGKIASKLGGFNLKLTGGIHRANPFDLVPQDRATTGNGYLQYDVSGRGSYKFKNGSELTLKSDYLRRDSNGVDVTPVNALLARTNSTETFLVSLSPYLVTSENGNFRIIGSYSLFRDQSLVDQRGSTQLDNYNETFQHLAQLQGVYNRRFSESNALTVGAEGFFERTTSERLVNGAFNRARGGLFAQDEWQIVKLPLVLFVPGIRVDADSVSGVAPTPKLAIRIDPVEHLSFKVSYGWGYRAPSTQEMFLLYQNSGVGYVVQGNPKLEPEFSQAINASVDYTPVPWFTGSINFYRNELDNLIAARTTTGNVPTVGDVAGTVFTYFNIANARTQGFESLFTFRPIENMRLAAGYTLLDAVDLDRQRRLDGRAVHRVNWDLSYRHAPWGLSGMIRGSFVSDRVFYYDPNGNELASPVVVKPYVSLDVRVQKTLGRYFDVFAGVDNIAGAGQQLYNALTPRIFYAGVNGRY